MVGAIADGVRTPLDVARCGGIIDVDVACGAILIGILADSVHPDINTSQYTWR